MVWVFLYFVHRTADHLQTDELKKEVADLNVKFNDMRRKYEESGRENDGLKQELNAAKDRCHQLEKDNNLLCVKLT